MLDVEEKIKTGKGPQDAGQFICMLISKLFQRMEPVLTALDDLTDDAEEKVLGNHDVSLRDNIVEIRKKAIMLRRYMAPQKESIS